MEHTLSISSSARRYVIIFLLVPPALILTAYILSTMPYWKYRQGIYEFLAFLFVVDLAAGMRGKLRDAATFAAAGVFGLAAIELGTAAFEPNASVETRGFSVSRPVLGWGPKAPGVYHAEKIGEGGHTIYSADYTVDDHLLRQTLSAPTGPSVAFVGDSLTFGQGVSDADTLPQAFADLTDRRIRVFNFGFPGYGPQQILRALETGLFDPLLSEAKTFVFTTANWHIERSSCVPGFMARAPRYELRDAQLVFMGVCAEGIRRVLQDIAGGIYRRFVQRATFAVGPQDVELYLAELRRCGELARRKYGARMIILYLSDGDAYLAKSGFTDAKIKERMRQSGLEVLDVSLSPDGYPPGTLFKIPGDGHPTAIANHVRAGMLKTYLESAASIVVASPAAK